MTTLLPQNPAVHAMSNLPRADGLPLQPEPNSIQAYSASSIQTIPQIQNFRFMDLPMELRRLMYEFFLSILPGVDFRLEQSLIDWSFSSECAAILLVSMKIYREALPVILGTNKFLIGSSLTKHLLTEPNKGILQSFNSRSSRCAFLRSLSIQLNGRPIAESIEIMEELSLYCVDIKHLELRISPGSPLLPLLASMLVARAKKGSSSTKICLRFFVKKPDPLMSFSDHMQIIQAATDIQQSFHSAFRWPELLERADEITIKGCVDKRSMDVLQNFHHQGWHFTKNITTAVANCPTRQENVMRTWERKAT